MIDLSRERRRSAISHLRRCGILDDLRLTEDALILYAISLLMCDEAGLTKKSEVAAAALDPSIQSVAEQLLAKARQS